MNWIAAAIMGGLVGTLAMTIVLRLLHVAGLPEIDFARLIGTLFSRHENTVLGWVLHFVVGSVFALLYATLWQVGVLTPTPVDGLIVGAAHWLIVGATMASLPVMHIGVQSGAISAPGAYMIKHGGMMSFLSGLLGHLVYGLVVTAVYSAIV